MAKILVTGAKGFVGKNLCWALKNIKDGKDRRFPELSIEEVYEYDIDTDPALLDIFCEKADFVFNLAGVNRPQHQEEFMQGNFGFASTLLDTLKKQGNRCPVMLSSSQQASLTGRFGNSEYGRSKKAGEDLFLEYEREFLQQPSTNSPLKGENEDPLLRGGKGGAPRVLVYRFPNLFGKWCRPNYNSAVATFCNAFANDLPYTVNDPSVELELLYIDDLVDEMIACLIPHPTSPSRGGEHRCEFNGLEVVPKEDGRYCYVPTTYKVTLGQIVSLLEQFHANGTLQIPFKEITLPLEGGVGGGLTLPPEGGDGGGLIVFSKKLYSTYLSYLPKEKVAFPLKMNVDDRGSFTELVHTLNCGQVSINISKPGITKGQHWHNTKWEFFIVVSGHGLIQERKLGTEEVIEFEVSGDNIQCVHMLPGYTHNIINLSDTENLVTVMYCNEVFNPNKPDTFGEPV
jgi:UDP-2-acetamido-2,6-beta-L-arabino-hexul-4-ose reductase